MLTLKDGGTNVKVQKIFILKNNMKNIHLQPTSQLSRLVKIYNEADKKLFELKLNIEVNDNFKEYQNIYITDSEKPKDGDWYIHKQINYLRVSNSTAIPMDAKKIILTTDLDLIKDGVQSIDNEFLEWFVKNQSCENVVVSKNSHTAIEEISYEGDFQNVDYNFYKIIIPKEEPKDVVLGYKTSLVAQSLDSHYVDFSNPNADKISSSSTTSIKQETLEEAAENHWKMQYIMALDESTKPYIIQDFISGAKWQQEQILQFLYSEIIERRPYSSSKMCEVVIEFIEQLNTKK
jgi:hypothetical protein